MQEIIIKQPAHDNPLLNFLEQYWRILAAILVAAVVLAGGYAGYTLMSGHSRGKAVEALGTIIAEKTGPERLTALESFLASAPSSVKPAVLLEIARTAQEQKAYDKAADAWAQLANIAPPGTRELAVIGQATALALGGNKTQAVNILSDFSTKAPKAFDTIVTRQLAVIAEEAGAWHEALTANLKLAAIDGLDPTTKAYYEAKAAAMKAKLQ